MANLDKPNGFRPVRYMNGAPWTGQARKYVIPAGDGTATFVGDLVKLDGTGDDAGYVTVVQAASSNPCVGVIVGMEVDPTNLNTPQYRAASTRRVVYVADDPMLVFAVQEDGDTDPLETTDLGLNINFLATAGSTVTGTSAMEINSDTAGTTSTLPLRLVGVVQSPDNENVLSAGGQSYTRWEVMINSHQYGVNSLGRLAY